MRIDRFAEKYPSYSPYHYAANNPIYFVDVMGDSLISVTHRGQTYIVDHTVAQDLIDWVEFLIQIRNQTLVVNNTYRTKAEQTKLYNNWTKTKSEREKLKKENPEKSDEEIEKMLKEQLDATDEYQFYEVAQISHHNAGLSGDFNITDNNVTQVREDASLYGFGNLGNNKDGTARDKIHIIFKNITGPALTKMVNAAADQKVIPEVTITPTVIKIPAITLSVPQKK